MNNDSIFVKKYKIMNKITTNKILNILPLWIKKLILLYTYNKKVKRDYMEEYNFVQSTIDLYQIISISSDKKYTLITKEYPPINISIVGNNTILVFSGTMFTIQILWTGDTNFTYDYYDSNNNRYSGKYDNTKEDVVTSFYEDIVYDTIEYVFYNLFKQYFLQIRDN